MREEGREKVLHVRRRRLWEMGRGIGIELGKRHELC